MAVDFKVEGPFRVPRCLDHRAQWLCPDVRRDFWSEPDLEALGNRRGCYVFAVQRSGRGGLKPWYVGRTGKLNFRRECFARDKVDKLNDRRLPKSGSLYLFLVVPAKERGRPPAAAIKELETLLIQHAEKKNPDLINVNQRAHPEVNIRGVFERGRGRPSQVAEEFRQLLGLHQ